VISQPQPFLDSEAADKLLKQGNFALWGKRYGEAIAALEAYCQGAKPGDRQYAQAQMRLLKAYQGDGQTEEAIALCRQMSQGSDPTAQLWAQSVLAVLLPPDPNAPIAETTPLKAEPIEEIPQLGIKLKTIDQLNQFYTNVLFRDLKKLEQQRQITLQSNIVVSSIIIFGLLLLFLTTIGQNLQALATPADSQIEAIALLLPVFGFAFAVLLGMWVWVTFFCYSVESYERGFKVKVIQKLVAFIDENKVLKYSQNCESGGTLTAFLESKIFKTQPNKIIQSDTISGRIGVTDICFSEICAEAEAGNSYQSSGLYSYAAGADSQDKSPIDAVVLYSYSLLFRAFRGCFYILNRLLRGQRINLEHFKSDIIHDQVVRQHVFKGLFFVGDFNKHFQGQTIVVPDHTERYLGTLAQDLQALNQQRGQLVKLEDPAFEKLFAVYGTDQIEARYILSPSLMQRLVDFTQKAQRETFISFINDKIYIAIKYDEDLFEPKLFKNMVDFAPVREYFETLQLMMGIIEELNLNRRIWTKQ
jgi:tetratricopeptide (TPR) repeat protein